MPYDSQTGGFTGNTNVATFIDEVVVPFMILAKGSGGLGWISQTPVGSPTRGKGSTPNFEFILSRGGVGSEAPPYWMCQTTAKSLFIYSGDGVNVDQESFNQPGNPMNEPATDPVTDPADTFALYRCLMLNTVVGSYDGYWLFGGDTGQYCHVVLKVSAREYRHFHVGLLDGFDPDFPVNSQYLTCHRWAFLAPDFLRATSNPTYSAAQDYEHQPYHPSHFPPFRNNGQSNITFTGGFNGDVRSVSMMCHVPGGYGTLGYEWWLMTGRTQVPATASVGRARNSSGNSDGITALTKTIGDVNASSDAVEFGCGFVSGYDKTFGTIPFQCDPTFTTDGIPLIPITVSLASDFESAIRWAPVAQVPDVFRVNMKSLDAEQEFTIGPDTYIAFPIINKDANNTIEGEGYSGFEGLAYKKITANAT